uniref:Methyltransferase-like protein 13 n=1 Tax=Parascaris univalens TaxID=6257 RepID=A0A914ZF07_PARUN
RCPSSRNKRRDNSERSHSTNKSVCDFSDVFSFKKHNVPALLRNGGCKSTNLSPLTIAVVMSTVIGAILLCGLITKVPTQTDSFKQESASSSSSQKSQSNGRSPTGESKPEQGRLIEGTTFLVGSYKTNENLLHVVDQVIRDQKNRIAVLRELKVEEAPMMALSRYRLVIPKPLPVEIDTSKWQIDYKYLDSEYLQILFAAGYSLGLLNHEETTIQMLSIGLGGATANLFLRYATENVNLTTVEIDETIVEVAKKYFGYVEDERQHCVVGDGVQFLSDSAREGNKFDIILLDASKNTEEVVICPVEAFLETSVIQSMVKTLRKHGILLLNYIALGATDVSLATVKKAFEEVFEGCISFDVPAKLNKVLVCVKRHAQYKQMQSEKFHSDMQKHLNAFANVQ